MHSFPLVQFENGNIPNTYNTNNMKIKLNMIMLDSPNSSRKSDDWVCKKVSICRIFVVNIWDKKKA